jgi:hypothetical protein
VTATNTDYVITDTRRAVSGAVTYWYTDTYGQRYHTTVAWHSSTPGLADRMIRHHIENYRTKHPAQ